MELSAVSIGAVVGVTVGLAIHFVRQARLSAKIESSILQALEAVESLTLPELVVHAGLRDGFLSRGKVMNAIHPLVAAGILLQEEPPGTTMKNRLSVLRFRLKARP